MGDCFDFAMVLCSLLLGAGYDAYVVYGTAPGCVPRKRVSCQWRHGFLVHEKILPSFAPTKLCGTGGGGSCSSRGGCREGREVRFEPDLFEERVCLSTGNMAA